jgi:hypothetical protein
MARHRSSSFTPLPRAVLGALAVAVLAPPALGQSLRDTFSQLFVFGPNGVQLSLPGSLNDTAQSIKIHGNHFIPAGVAANGALIGFISNAIAAGVSNAPISATSSGTSFGFEGGVPVAAPLSSGPIFAERAPTLGKGRVFLGFLHSGASYSAIRGVPMSDIKLTFTHENVTDSTDPGCSASQGANCALMGVPKLENDIMLFDINLNVDEEVTSMFFTYGLLDRLDISFALPLIQVSMNGTSTAEIVPFGGPPAVHFFAGTPDNPVLGASTSVSNSKSGIGDVALRAKLNLSQSQATGFALLLDARFPTGSVENMMGSGSFWGRALAIVSAQFGDFGPHINAGYLWRTAPNTNDAVLATVGFDQKLANWATLDADVISEFQVGASHYQLPGPVTYDAPFHRVIQTSSIPDINDDLVEGSFGFKLRVAGELTVVANALVPLNQGGMRADLVSTLGMEYGF